MPCALCQAADGILEHWAQRRLRPQRTIALFIPFHSAVMLFLLAGAFRGCDDYDTVSKAGIQKGRMAKQFFVYIMAGRRNGTLYVGITSNLAQRVWYH